MEIKIELTKTEIQEIIRKHIINEFPMFTDKVFTLYDYYGGHKIDITERKEENEATDDVVVDPVPEIRNADSD